MMRGTIDEIRKIGFNNDVKAGGRTLHVQTEVTVGKLIRIRTTVLERGVVQGADSQTRPLDEQDPDIIRTLAFAQHERNVSTATQVALGETGGVWPA
jgi:hypothetical protein